MHVNIFTASRLVNETFVKKHNTDYVNHKNGLPVHAYGIVQIKHLPLITYYVDGGYKKLGFDGNDFEFVLAFFSNIYKIVYQLKDPITLVVTDDNEIFFGCSPKMYEEIAPCLI